LSMFNAQSTKLIEALSALFNQHANPTNAIAMNAYMKDIAPYYGVKTDLRRSIQKDVPATWHPDWVCLQGFVLACWQQPQREWQYCGLEALMQHKKLWKPDAIDLIAQLITTKSWWDTVDTLASNHCGWYFKKHPEQMKHYIQSWIESNNMWLNRTAIIFQLKYRDKTNTNILRQSITPHLASKEFFLQKAIGWALRQYARTDELWVRTFVAHHELKPLSKREALKHLH